MTAKTILAAMLAALLPLLGASAAENSRPDPNGPAPASEPLRIVVMDPLCEQLACDCVGGYAQRNYEALGKFLEQKLSRPVEIAYVETLSSPHAGAKQGIDLVVGKFSTVVFDAQQADLGIRTVAMLTDQRGSITQTGLFVVRQADPARSVEDLAGHRLLFGPEDSDEKRCAALAVLEAFDLPAPKKIAESSSCSTAALAVAEEDADAAVISSYAMPLLEGCGTVDKDALRIVGETAPVPFIGLFATDRLGTEAEEKLTKALLDVRNHPDLLAALQSRDGLLRLPSLGAKGQGATKAWADWRGPRRDAISADVPETLPDQKRLLWALTLTGAGMSGLAVDATHVVAADKSLDEKQDIFRCLDADTGRQIWRLAYPAAGEMDFTNSPRANPVIHRGLVYLLGAFGDLHCVKLDTGEVVWKKHLVKDFGSELPMWGFSSTPLIVGDRLIVNPGAEKAALAALDRRTGKVLWATPGDPPGYASFILATLGGVRQIVGYDAISLGGWDPATGKRLWRLVPEFDGDFNVPTPIAVGDKLLVSTENNGTRLYGFDSNGRIRPRPLAANEDLIPDTSSPVVLDSMVFGSCGALWCLDLDAGLKTLWENDQDDLLHYCSLIAGNGRVLVVTQTGKLYLLAADKKGFECISSLELFDDVPDTERDVWSHPALVGNRLYVRNLLGVYCFLLE